MHDDEFTGRVALVTGGGSGIGAATARLFAESGASVVVADILPSGAADVAAEITSGGGSAVSIGADVSDGDQVDAMMALAIETYGGLDLAFNNAGISGVYGPLADLSVEDWQRTIDINLAGVFRCIKAEVPLMLARGGGSIVNTSSAAGQMGFAMLPAYVAAKHGVVGLTRSAALEYARAGIRVNAVLPGTVHTPMMEAFAGSVEGVAAMAAPSPAGRAGTPEEVAEAAVWLSSDAARFVNGHCLAVDGGILAT